MPAPKGHKGYKPKGAISAKTIAWNNLGEFLTEQGAERLIKILSEADDATFMKVYIQLIEYFRPKQSRTELEKTNDKGKIKITVNRLGDSYPPRVTAKLPDGQEIEI